MSKSTSSGFPKIFSTKKKKTKKQEKICCIRFWRKPIGSQIVTNEFENEINSQQSPTTKNQLSVLSADDVSPLKCFTE